MESFAQELRAAGFRELRLLDTATKVFRSHWRSAMTPLGKSRMIVGRK